MTTTGPTDQKPRCPLCYCSFCGKSEHEVNKLIAGLTVFICDECVSLSVGIIQQADNSYFYKIKHDLMGDEKMKKNAVQTIDAPDEFWILIDQQEIYERLAGEIITKNLDMSDLLSERAYNYMQKSRAAQKAAWKIMQDAHPEFEAKQMSAAVGIRKVSVYDY